MHDDLLRPVAAEAPAAARPWQLTERFWPVLGGPVALTTLAYLNARRLGVGPGRQVVTLVVGAVSLVGASLVGAALEGWVRWVSRVTVVLVCYLVQLWLQRPAAKAYEARGGQYGSPSARLGIPAVIIGLILLVAGEEIAGSLL